MASNANSSKMANDKTSTRNVKNVSSRTNDNTKLLSHILYIVLVAFAKLVLLNETN